jgi:ribosomal protein S13
MYITSQNGQILEDITEYGLINDLLINFQMNNSVRDGTAMQFGFEDGTGNVSQGHAIASYATTLGSGVSSSYSYSVPILSGLIGALADKFLNIDITAFLDQKYFNGIGAYLVSEIVGRLDVDPFRTLKSFSNDELDNLFKMIHKCISESYSFGGGELISWTNPIYKSRIDEWIKFYNNKDICHKQKFGTRNIWIQNKFKKKLVWS